MAIELYDHQIEAIQKLKNGNILCGGVGTGKSRTALAYYYLSCGGKLSINGVGNTKPMTNPRKLYIITPAKKRDTSEWEAEMIPFLLKDVVIDSWNNVYKYTKVKDAFFIFDEQRVIGSGKWAASFIKITKSNKWILLSATPGDNWMDYIPVFVANGFYKNRTDFISQHVIYNRYARYPKVEHYLNVSKLNRLRKSILVDMKYQRQTVRNYIDCYSVYDEESMKKITKDRWNIYTKRPVRDAADYCRCMRKLVNSDPSKLIILRDIYNKRQRCIVFYNFNYELEILKSFAESNGIVYSEWNGHYHKPIPKGPAWLYFVQYTAGAEGWNCTSTDTIVFFSQQYSYKIKEQSSGRIDRLNTPYSSLYYYTILSKSSIDMSISNALSKKQDFSEKQFAGL